jgi:SHS2 domain-containing protein
MSYQLRDHTADIAVEATGETLGAVVAAIADGMSAAMCETWPEDGERFQIAVEAESKEAAVFEYLDELLYQRDVRSVLPVDHEATVTERPGGWHVEGTARGVPLSTIRARELKAVTYSEFEVVRTDDGWRGYVVFDV